MKPDPSAEAALVTGAAAGVIGLMVGIARGVIHNRHGSVGQWLGGVAAAVLVSVLLGWGLEALATPRAWQYPIIGACAYVADDVLAGLRTLGQMVRSDPIGGVMRVLDALRGRSVQPPAPPAPPADDAGRADGAGR